MNSNKKAKIAEEAVAATATQKGLIVLRPNVECSYDLVFDDGTKFTRVQVKYANSSPSKSDGSVIIRFWTTGNGKEYRKYYTSKDTDLILIFIAETKQIIVLNPSDFDNKTTLTFRVHPAKNGQKKKIRLIKDYLW